MTSSLSLGNPRFPSTPFCPMNEVNCDKKDSGTNVVSVGENTLWRVFSLIASQSENLPKYGRGLSPTTPFLLLRIL